MPPSVKPVLSALSRLQQRTVLQPAALGRRAEELLVEHFGGAPGPVEGAFAHGATGLISEHTHLFDGFALLLPLPHGTAVALRDGAAATGRMVFGGDGEVWTMQPAAASAGERPSWICVVEALVEALAPAGANVDVAVVSTVSPASTDSYLAALGVALARGLRAFFALPLGAAALVDGVRDVVAACLGRPYSVVYPLAADADSRRAMLLVDAAERERIALDLPSNDILGWGLVSAGTGPLRDAAFYAHRREQADRALAILRTTSFPGLASFRDLEHQDLQRALHELPAGLRPTARHLVTENRRVQRMVGAVRRADWQLMGALLLMTHASIREDWGGSHPDVDRIVDEVKDLTTEGVHGACLTDAGGTVLIAGQPFVIPQALDQVKRRFETARAEPPGIELL